MKHSPRLLTAVLAACFLLTSCSSLQPREPALPKPLPSEYAVRCPPPTPDPASSHVDDVAATLKDLYDAYGVCAGRYVDFLNWIDGSAN